MKGIILTAMNYRVFWNGEEKSLTTANINEPCYNNFVKQELALFSVKGSGRLTVKSDTPVKSVIIRPLSLGIKPTIEDSHTKAICLYLLPNTENNPNALPAEK